MADASLMPLLTALVAAVAIAATAYAVMYPYISADRMAALLDLPLGTLTQRTLTFAVRTHPEQPASAASHLSPLLARETESHSLHQASIALQGHHHWEGRFHAINARLPAGLLAREVCAESWPGQSLVEAADSLERRSRDREIVRRQETSVLGVLVVVSVDEIGHRLTRAPERILRQRVRHAPADQCIGSAVERGDELGNPCPVRTAVVVGEREVFAARALDRTIARVRRPAVARDE